METLCTEVQGGPDVQLAKADEATLVQSDSEVNLNRVARQVRRLRKEAILESAGNLVEENAVMSVNSRKRSDHNVTNNHGARVKLRWMELDVEGGTADLVEGFKSFATALTRNTLPIVPVRELSERKTASDTSTTVIEAPVKDDESTEVEGAESTGEVDAETNSGNGTQRSKRRPAPRAPKFLNDLDLTNTPVQLTDFVQEKSPDGDMDKYAVIAAWFKQHFNTQEVTIDHIFTAYKALGWQAQLPADPSQTFRNLKSNKNWFDSGSKRGAYKINWHGESAVNKMGAAKP